MALLCFCLLFLEYVLFFSLEPNKLMKWLKFHPLRHLRYVKYTEFHEDSEFRHESSRNCDPMRFLKENPDFRKNANYIFLGGHVLGGQISLSDMRPQSCPKTAQDGPKTAPRRPKKAPRWPQDGPRRPVSYTHLTLPTKA